MSRTREREKGGKDREVEQVEGVVEERGEGSGAGRRGNWTRVERGEGSRGEWREEKEVEQVKREADESGARIGKWRREERKVEERRGECGAGGEGRGEEKRRNWRSEDRDVEETEHGCGGGSEGKKEGATSEKRLNARPPPPRTSRN